MGWNDHVEFLETECLECGETDTWEYWDAVGKTRYVGAIGQMVGQDPANNDRRCPNCGSTKGRIVQEEL
jgi:ribosomal protein S27AE